MKKNFAFLFYVNDWAGATQWMTRTQRGAYFDLLLYQVNNFEFSLDEVKRILNSDFENCWNILESKFILENGKYHNKKMREVLEARQKFTESRRNNRNKLNNDSLHIYFIKNPKTGWIKIGSSVDIERRFLELKRQYNESLKILFISKKYPQTKEKELHDIFKDKKEINEWYSLSKNDLKKIKNELIELHIDNDMKLHIDNDMEKEKEREIEIEKEIEIRGVQGGIEKADEIFKIISENQQWIEVSLMALGLRKTDESQLISELKSFLYELAAKGDLSKGNRAITAHFISWFKLKLEKGKLKNIDERYKIPGRMIEKNKIFE